MKCWGTLLCVKIYIFWILSGQVFTIPRSSQIKVRKSQKSFKNQALSETKVNTTISGFVHLTTNTFNRNNTNLTSLKVQNFFQSLNQYKFFIEKKWSFMSFIFKDSFIKNHLIFTFY